MGVFWPATKDGDDEIIGRFGRLTHWAAASVATLIGIVSGICLCIALSRSTEHDASDEAMAAALFLLVLAVALLLAGRGIRYVLTGE